jgi:DNA mismatch repair ATPase MutS
VIWYGRWDIVVLSLSTKSSSIIITSLLGIPDAVIKGADQKVDNLRHLKKTTATLPSL